MKTETKRSLRMLSFALAMLMLLSSVPTGTVAAEWESSDLVITNPGNDNEYVVNDVSGKGSSSNPYILENETYTNVGANYFQYDATEKGRLLVTITTEATSVAYNTSGSWYSESNWIYSKTTNTISFEKEMEQTESLLFQVRVYDVENPAGYGKNTYVKHGITMTVTFIPEGGSSEGGGNEGGSGEDETKYTITWVVDGQENVTTIVGEGETPAYPNGTPTKAATAEYSYTFAGWTPKVVAATADATYTATWTQTAKEYTITLNIDGELYKTLTYKYGDAVILPTPAKEGNTCTTYTFSGWGENVPATMPAENLTFEGSFAATTNHQQNPIYTNNGATHSATYPCCGAPYVENEAHSYVDGQCVHCGAPEPTETPLIIGKNDFNPGVVYAYTATEDCVISFSFSMKKNGETYYGYSGYKIKINGVNISSLYGNKTLLRAGEIFTLELVSENEDDYTGSTVTLTQNAVQLLTEGQNTAQYNINYVFVAPQDGDLYLSILQMLDQSGNVLDEAQLKNMSIKVNNTTLTALDKTLTVKTGDQVTITVGKYKASVVFFLSYEGYQQRQIGDILNPIVLNAKDCPTQTAEIAASASAWYKLNGFEKDDVLTIAGENYYAMVDGSLTNPVDGVVTITVDSSSAILIQIVNTGDTAATYRFEIPSSCDHANKVHHVQVAATCVATGTIEYWSCPDCEKNFSDEACTTEVTKLTTAIDPNNHDLKITEAKAPTCTAIGWEEYVTCQREGCTYSTYQEITALGHDYKDGFCQREGCGAPDPNYCDHAKNATLVAEQPATCKAPGHKAYYQCTCGKLFSDAACTEEIQSPVEIPRLDHVSGQPVQENMVPATCTVDGSYDEVVRCINCTAEISRTKKTTEAIGHTEVTDKAVAPTCTETGLTEGSHCSVCDAVIVAQKTVDALGHSYGSWMEGKKTCSTCGDVLNCQHRGGYATCIRLAVCSECNMSYGPYGDHTPKTSEGKDPTCTEPGLTDGSYCSRYGCGKVLVEQEEIPATGEHIYENGKCTMCGGDRTVLECEHQWSDATCTAPKTCPKCGSTEGNALGHNYVNDECTKCGDTGIAIPEDGKLVSGQLYVYTATEAVHLTINLGGMKDSSGKNIYTMDDKTVMVQINGALKATQKIDSYLAEGQSVKLMLVAMNDKTYTATAELTEKALSFLTLGENTIKPETEYIYVAEKTGTVYLTVVDGTVKVNGEEPSEQYSVEAGEMITVTNKGEVDAHITLRFEGKDEHAPGSEKNPLALPFANCPANTAEIAAGGTLYYQLSDFKNGYVLKVTGENAYIMVNDTRYNAENGVVTLKVSGNHLIQIGNAGTETATFAMETYIPVGHSENPDTLTSGKHTVDLPTSSTYYYAFTATEDIEATIRVSGSDYWRFFISHIDADGNKITDREDHRGDRGDKDTVELVLAAGETIILELTTYSGGVIGGTVTADVTIRSTAVAQINGVKYKTLADAIEAATNGDTIILLSDLDLNHEDAQNYQPEEKNGYQVMFVVADKNITIDLNGKTISVDATTGFGEGTILAFPENDVGMIDWKADRLQGMLMAVIAVHNNGHLTLKDSVGTGGIKTEAWNGDKDNTACGIVYSVLTNYSTDSSITIEGGRYEADFTRDCLVYTYASANEGQGNVGVVVNGGTFYLGNAGQGRNYSTWIFNAKGQNERHVWVTGGTFSTDIRHQYWVFEAQIDKECALVKQGDFYTIVPAVAYVTEREWSSAWYTYETGYATLEEAIAACEGPKTKTYYSKEYVSEQEIVVLLQNITLSNEIVIPEGKTVAIDRNGYEITGTITGEVIYYNKGELINQEENEGEGESAESEA